MANNRVQVKRTSTTGRTPNTTASYATNSQYISAGELALNMTDGILYSSNGSGLIEIGANNTNARVTGNLTINAIVSNGSLGSSGQVLTSNGSSTYWSTLTSIAAAAGGSNTQIQFNDSTASNGSAGFTFIKTTNNVNIANSVNAASYTIGTSFTTNSTMTNTVSLVVSTNTATIGTGTYFVSNGNVGIGTATPSSRLEVIGNSYLNGAVTTGALKHSPVPISKLLNAFDAADSDSFSNGLAEISDDASVLAVGVRSWEGATGTNRGGVYIYDWNGFSWVQRGPVLEAADAADGDNFGSSVSLSSNGSILAVGARGWEGATGTDRGGVYIYDWNGSAWVQRGSVIEAADAADSDLFGGSVSLSANGSILAVGSIQWVGATGTFRGGVYIYDWNGSAWVQRGSVLEPADAADSDTFGRVSLSANGSILAVGAGIWEGSTGTDRGGVYIYDWNGSSWVQRGSVIEAVDAADGDQFGTSVSLSANGSILAVGAAIWEGSTGTDRGGVYIYDWNGSSWVQRGSVLEAVDAADGDQYTWVSLSGDGSILTVGGAGWEGTTGTNRGAVYTYSLTGALPSYSGVATGSGWIEGSNSALIARTSGLDRVTIDSNGNIGIGTSSPSGLLHLQSSNPTIFFNSTSSSRSGYVGMFDTFNMIVSGATSGWLILDSPSGVTTFRNSNVEVGRFAGANLGIGTSAPAYNLHVSGGVGVTGNSYSNNLFLNFNGTDVYAYTSVNIRPDTYSIPTDSSSVVPLNVNPRISYTGNTFFSIINIVSRPQIVTTSNNSQMSIACFNGQSMRDSPTDSSNVSNFLQVITGAAGHWQFVNSAAVSSSAYGGNLNTYNYSGTITNQYGYYTLNRVGFAANYSANTTNVYGLYTLAQVGATSGTGTGRLTNYYDAYLAGVTVNATGTVTNKYGIYQAATDHINYFGGNIGIGTSSPVSRLDVTSSTNTSIILIHTALTGSTATDGFELSVGDNASWVWNYENTPIIFGANNAESMRITNAGNVGIGTSSPTQKLDVNGSIAITAAGARIVGDFVGATVANRVLFQSSSANTNTSVGAIPNGTGTAASFTSINNSDPTNSAYFAMTAAATEARIRSDIIGTGAYIPITLWTGGSERMRIDNSGNVGIGTSSPLARLHVVGGFTAFQHNSGGNYPNYNNFFGAIASNFSNGGSELDIWNTVGSGFAFRSQTNTAAQTCLMYIGANGNVGIGTSSPGSKLHIEQTGISTTTTVMNTVTEANAVAATIFDFDQYTTVDGGGSSMLRFRKANGTKASPTVVGANRATGRVGSQIYDGTAFYDNGLILFSADGTPATGSTPGRIQFYTTASGSTTLAERMRIDSSGNVGIGTTAPSYRMHISEDNGGARSQLYVTDTSVGYGVYVAGGMAYNGTISNHAFGILVNNTERMRIAANGNIGIGTSSPNTKFVVSDNAVVPTTTQTGRVAHFVGSDTATARILIDSIASTVNISTRRANGTAASPSALLTGETLLNMGSFGYGATGYTAGARASITSTTAENWTDSAQGTYWTFSTTAIGSTTLTERMRIDASGNILPGADNTQNLGSTSLRWANIYTGDLHLCNEKSNGNDIDGTTGNWTLQEGETELYIINNKNGKKFKFKLEEIQ